jgi:tetratricopeptide (TPR) repeat protein
MATKTAPAKTAPAKKAPAKKAAAPAKKVPAAAKKVSAPAKKAVAAKVPTKKTAPAKAPAKAPAAPKKVAAPAKKAAPAKAAAATKKASSSGFNYAAAALKQHWARLHAGDGEPFPKAAAVLAAWQLFHAGDFKKALDAALKAGAISCANKAQAMYATYVEKSESAKQKAFLEVAKRAEAQQANEPDNANAWYWQAYALGRYGQSISVVEALSQGLGTKVRQALEQAIALQPKHADAHIALGAFHAEVIDKVGKLLARGQGADARTGLQMFEAAQKLVPHSAIAMIERANGLVMIEGERRMAEAEALYAAAAKCLPMDATERFDVEMAKSELEDE